MSIVLFSIRGEEGDSKHDKNEQMERGRELYEEDGKEEAEGERLTPVHHEHPQSSTRASSRGLVRTANLMAWQWHDPTLISVG